MTERNHVDKTIWTGDNLHIVHRMNSELVTYPDTPFNSNLTYVAPQTQSRRVGCH